MQNKEGAFIVIEGTDGSGKSTQFNLLTKRLEDAGYDIATFKFPQYDEPSSYFVKQYLSGVYGSVDKIGPYTASLFYALDRYAAAARIRDALSQGKIVVVDRYTGSNMAHQGAKFYHADQRRGYFIWLDNLEFEMLKIPRPDANFVLNVPAAISQELLTKSEKKRDIHEADIEHLKRSVEVFYDLCQLFPKDFIRIDCVRNEALLSKEMVSNLIWEKVFPLLPIEKRQKRVAQSATDPADTAITENKYVETTRTGTGITAEGRELLEKIVTDTNSEVFAFKDRFDATVLAAAITRSTHHTQDVRTILLESFSDKEKTNEEVQRVVTKYATTVQKLVGIHLTVEQQSQLTATVIAQGRRATYVMPTTSASRYDEKDAHGQYKYFTPDNLKGQLARDYRQRMDTIFDSYATIVARLTQYLRERASMPQSEQTSRWRGDTLVQACEAASAVLPVAATSPVSIFATAKDVQHIIYRLMGSSLPEAQRTGQKMLEQAKQVAPVVFEDFRAPTEQTSSTLRQMAEDYLPDNYAASFAEPVALSDFWPRNELDLVPDMLFAYSNMPLTELKQAIDKWPYERKAAVLTAYLKDRSNYHKLPGHAIEKAHYTWDMISDYTTFQAMLRHQNVDSLHVQQLTPRNGYEVPALIEDAGLSDLYEACFDSSLELHSMLFEAGYTEEAQYATLMGHRLRWTATYNAREVFHLTSKQSRKSKGKGSHMVALLMRENIAGVHPIIADAMQ
jgi:dTMP kinase